MKVIRVCTMLMLLCACTGSGAMDKLEQAPFPPLPERDKEIAQRLSDFRAARNQRDASRATALAEVAKTTTNPYLFYGSLRALAQISGKTSLDVTKQVRVKFDQDYEARSFVKAVEVRVAAQMAAEQEPSDQRVQTLLWTFYAELGCDASTFNRRVKEQLKDAQTPLHPKTGVMIWALRELADMIYSSQDEALLNATRESGVDFGLDYPAAVKIQIALLPKRPRIELLIGEMLKEKTITTDTYALYRLLAEEGDLAFQAAASKLAEMNANRDRYASVFSDRRFFPDFTKMFVVLALSGDMQYASTLSRFIDDAEPDIAHYAKQAHQRLIAGGLYPYLLGY